MLIFGPFTAVPLDDDKLQIFNLSSPTEIIQPSPGLLPSLSYLQYPMTEEEFDRWYYNYLLEYLPACQSLMEILTALYDCKHVYVCISDYSEGFLNIINESFMKMIQSRYGIKYAIINTREDLEYNPKDGCDFRSVQGIKTFDDDRKRYLRLLTEQQIIEGH